MSTRKCSRCGGSGLVSRGQVINGVCYGCGGNGEQRIRPRAERKSGRTSQYVIVDLAGRHLALNTDYAALEKLFSSLSGAYRIENF